MCEKCVESLHTLVFEHNPQHLAEIHLPELRTLDGVSYAQQSDKLAEASFTGITAAGVSAQVLPPPLILAGQGVQRPIKIHLALLQPTLLITAVGGQLTSAAGFLTYEDVIGNLHTLGAWSVGSLSGTIAELTAFRGAVIVNAPITSAYPANIGRLLLDVRYLSLGTATSLSVVCDVNIGIVYER